VLKGVKEEEDKSAKLSSSEEAKTFQSKEMSASEVAAVQLLLASDGNRRRLRSSCFNGNNFCRIGNFSKVSLRRIIISIL